MANRDPLYECDTGFVTLFARAPQLCAGTLAGLASALWLSVVAPFAGLAAAWGTVVLVNGLAIAVVAALAVIATTAGTLLAADWRADAANRQAWAEAETTAVELPLPAWTAARSQIDPRYLTNIDNEALRSAFCARRFTPQALAPDASTPTPPAGPATRIVAASGESTQTPAEAASTARKIAADVSDVARARPYPKAASTSFGQRPVDVAPDQARPRVFRAEPTVSVARLVANGGTWSEPFPHHRNVLTHAPWGRVADIVVLSGDRGDRGQRDLPDPSTCDGTARRDAPPSCRGPPTAGGQRAIPRQTKLVEVSVEKPGTVGTAGALRPADPIVHDNLGRRVPVCAAELDAIETYLDRMLRDVLAMTNSDEDSRTS